MIERWLACALLFTCAACPRPGNFAVRSASLPACSDVQRGARELAQRSFGVVGRDPVGERIDSFRPRTIGEAESYHTEGWRPMTPWLSKRTVCGLATAVEFKGSDAPDFDARKGADRHEQDCSHLIAPQSQDYCFAVEAQGGDDCRGGASVCAAADHKCVMTEITGDDAFRAHNDFFCSGNRAESRLLDHEVCLYGALAWDVLSKIPEIHPAELFWWRGDLPGVPVAGPPSASALWLMAFQDDSNRFDSVDTYDFDGRPQPPGWRPWAAVPRIDEFDLPFALLRHDAASPDGRPRHPLYQIEEYEAVNVVTGEGISPDLDDADDGYQHALEWDGDVVLRVDEEGAAEDPHLDVRFADLCYDGEARTLRGVIRLTTRLGALEPHREGHHILRVVESSF